MEDNLEETSKSKSGRCCSRKCAILVAGIVTIAAVLAIVLGVALGTKPASAEPPPPTPGEQEWARIDCYPEGQWGSEDVSESKCVSRGCKYDPFPGSGDGNLYIPPCYVSADQGSMGKGYKFVAEEETPAGVRWQLSANDDLFTDVIQNVAVDVEFRTQSALRIKFYDRDNERYEIPEEVVRINLPEQNAAQRPSSETKYEVRRTSEDPFHFQLIRRTTGTVIWDTSVGGLVLANQFLSLSTKLPSKHIYGFGENSHESFRHDINFRTWPLFARDQWVGTGIHNHYSVHPFYTCLEEDGNSHGVLLFNSNAMDYTLAPLPMLTYRTIGGVLDFYIFLGPTPENVVQQYTGAIGRPYMPPYWSLGFQLCRYGYNSLHKLQEAVNRTLAANIPLDVQYADIDHYDVRKVFTIDKVNFQGLPEYFDYLRANGMRTIIILDPTFPIDEDGYIPYQRGNEADIYIKWKNPENVPDADKDEKGAMLGYVWPYNKVVFPDFLHPETGNVWYRLIVDHFNEIRFDGLWIDMNEPANFGTNEAKPWNWPPEWDEQPWSLKCPDDALEDPKYRTMAAYAYDRDAQGAGREAARISDKTLCMTAVQKQGAYNHYDVHNLYGASQIDSTLRALRNATGKRGIVVGRSTFPGSGHQSGHWLGDNFSTWKQMSESIIGMMEFNLFGFPYIGADICGFFGETNAELCKRWMQLGAFYPYSRNHNQADNLIDQDPANFNEEVTKLSRDALRLRYILLPHLYTLFYHAHTRGATVIRPLFHEFPKDETARGIDKQFLWGSGLLVTPILDLFPTLTYYLPQGKWYDVYTNKVEHNDESGKMYTMNVETDSPIPLFLRGGTIFPTQHYANNTYYSRKNTMNFWVYLDSNGRASGDLFWDDGESIETIEAGDYFYATLRCEKNVLVMSIQHNNIPDQMTALKLDFVRITGIGETRPTLIVVDDQTILDTFVYASDTETLTVAGLDLNLNQDIKLEWRYSVAPTDEELSRLECLPDGGDETKCGDRGCFWIPSTASGVPWCYLDNAKYGYVLDDVTTLAAGQTAQLTWKNQSSLFGGDFANVVVEVEYRGPSLLRIKIRPSVARYEVPVPLHLPDLADQATAGYRVEFNQSTFAIRVIRESSGTVIWDTTIGGLTVAEQFLQIAVKVPSTKVFGFGENKHPTYRHNFDYQTWPMFSRDQAPGWGDYGNLYGVHPYYMCVEDTSGQSHGVLLLNSNAMEVKFQPTPAITYRTIGGILDFYLVLGDSPEAVTQSYNNLIGRPYLPPYWSLGFQLCRYGYKTLANLKAAVDRTIAANIPYDVQYGDIDHFEDNKDFTWDKENFAEMPQYFKHLQDQHMRTIIILDPAIVTDVPDYEVYTSVADQDMFIKWPDFIDHSDIERFGNRNMHGYVWPNGPTVFPDFFNNQTYTWWKTWIISHYQNIPFDGLWIDMNEPANFGTNEEKPWNWPPERNYTWSLKCPNNQWDDPPYKPRAIFGPRLSDKTLCMVGQQTDGQKVYSNYDVHSLYGWSQTEPTLRALRQATGERGIVVTRSTYVSSGTASGHWLGDNDSSWAHLKDSIVGMLEFNIFGIPYIGADICGYFADTTPELCERWMQLGAFYPFSRNHNGFDGIDQDPGSLGREVAESSRRALEVRYTLLHFLYTLFYKAHMYGNTVVRPLLHEFYSDQATYDIDTQFLWGAGVMISPVVTQGATTRDAYFPSNRWFDYYTGEEVMSTGRYHILDAPLDHIPVHIRGGFIIPTQEPANMTYYSRQKPLGLLIAPDDSGNADGELFWDDGQSIDTLGSNQYGLYNFTLSGAVVTMTIDHGTTTALPNLGTIRIFGVADKPSMIAVTTPPFNRDTFIYYPHAKELLITDLDLPMDTEWTVTLET